jgi:hypothetical protein
MRYFICHWPIGIVTMSTIHLYGVHPDDGRSNAAGIPYMFPRKPPHPCRIQATSTSPSALQMSPILLDDLPNHYREIPS